MGLSQLQRGFPGWNVLTVLKPLRTPAGFPVTVLMASTVTDSDLEMRGPTVAVPVGAWNVAQQTKALDYIQLNYGMLAFQEVRWTSERAGARN